MNFGTLQILFWIFSEGGGDQFWSKTNSSQNNFPKTMREEDSGADWRIYENSSKISAGGVPNLLKFGWLSLVDCSSARIKASHLSLPYLPGEWVILQLQCGVCKVNWLYWQLSLDVFHLEMQISLHCAYKPCTVSKHWGWKIALC